MRPSRMLISAVLAIGVAAVSVAAIFIRLGFSAAGQSGPGVSLLLAAMRLGVAALLVGPAWRGLLRNKKQLQSSLVFAVGAGMFLALHFAFWVTSLSYTSIAASVSLVTTSPVWITLLAWLLWKERPKRLTWLGISLALLGALIIGASSEGSHSGARAPLLGNLLALAGAWAVSLYFLLGREAQRRGMSVGQYVAVAYGAAAVVLFPLPLIFHTSYGGWPLAVYGYAAAMALIPQLVGHTSLNWSMRWISPTLVTLAVLFEPVGSSFLGYLVFGEIPGIGVIWGGLVLLAGVAVAVIADRRA